MMTLPFSLRVSATSATSCRASIAAVSKSSVWYSDSSSLSLAKRISVSSRRKRRKAARCRSTQKASDRLSATCRPAAWAASAASKKASCAAGGSNR